MSTQANAATGRRKTAIARVELKEGSGSFTINGRLLEEYFPTLALQNQVLLPLHLLSAAQKFDVSVKTSGGGVTGQVGAIRLGIARALIQHDAEHRPILKKKGLLTRDPRAKERLKPGRPGARKRFQFSKR